MDGLDALMHSTTYLSIYLNLTSIYECINQVASSSRILFRSILRTTTETSSHKSRTVGIGSEDIYEVSLKKKQKHTIFRCNSTAKARSLFFFKSNNSLVQAAYRTMEAELREARARLRPTELARGRAEGTIIVLCGLIQWLNLRPGM